MAKTKEEDLPLNKMVQKVAMYGTEDSRYHKVGEKTMVDPSMVSHFEKRGLSQTKPEIKPADAEKGDKK